MLGLWRALFHIWSNVHRQHLNGTLDPALYDAVVQEVSTYSGNGRGADTVDDGGRRGRQMQWAWESERFIFNLEFQMFIDGILGIDRQIETEVNLTTFGRGSVKT